MQPNYKHAGPIAATGKGIHLLFAANGNANAAKLNGVPLDYRGTNGYIAAAPSVHPLGHRYQWKRQGHSLPAIPQWLADLLHPTYSGPTTPAPSRYTDFRTTVAPIREIMQALAKGPITRAGNRMGAPVWKMHCPFHVDDTPSMVLNEWNNTFRCFGCDAWGDNLNIHKFLTHGVLR